MSVKWLGIEKEGLASLYSTNMTLNSTAALHFEEAYRVQIGIDDNGNIVIKPISKERYDRGDLEENSLYDMVSKKSYARLSSTPLMSKIGKELGLELGKSPLQFKAVYDKANDYLVVKVKEE